MLRLLSVGQLRITNFNFSSRKNHNCHQDDIRYCCNKALKFFTFVLHVCREYATRPEDQLTWEIMKIGYFHRLPTFYYARVKDIVHNSEKQQCCFIQGLLTAVRTGSIQSIVSNSRQDGLFIWGSIIWHKLLHKYHCREPSAHLKHLTTDTQISKQRWQG